IENSSQVIQANLNYDGYGNVTESNSAVGDRYKFTAREFDANTGLQYNRARYYDPTTGRWTSEDPSSFAAADSNLYRYAQNDSQNATDSSGLFGVFLDGSGYGVKDHSVIGVLLQPYALGETKKDFQSEGGRNKRTNIGNLDRKATEAVSEILDVLKTHE